MNNYEELLERAIKQTPKGKTGGERFEIPKVSGRIEGNKTIINNFTQIASQLHREPKQLLKYLQRGLATPAVQDNQRLVIGRKIGANIINEKIKKYVDEFVLCNDCKRPDTKLIKENRVLIMKCMACGAKHPIKSKI